MTPELDPVICAELEAAVERIAKLSRHSHVQHPGSWTRDPGAVPPRIPGRLAGLVARYGFTMKRTHLPSRPGATWMGATGGNWEILPPEHRMKVMINKNMSAASEARVMAHEAAHVILGHVGLTPPQAYQKMMKRINAMQRASHLGEVEDPDEEAAAELAAGAFCHVAGIGTGKFSRQFINQKTGGKRVSAEAIAAGKLAARILYAAAKPALQERQAA